eukprot:CAMPEP_0195599388 /NCGR_PEP_ID=MMETSP0815-20121206/4007_1 /TAXON_ID=97485 /ORGANISM="Prymnesium parvum, Strain Texoma1" /LENGTH=1645 /DNA_ID=CAMNT_0040738823 /DNA_START=358 /DNA_END=5295 /DNA_ORIENTATION=+
MPHAIGKLYTLRVKRVKVAEPSEHTRSSNSSSVSARLSRASTGFIATAHSISRIRVRAMRKRKTKITEEFETLLAESLCSLRALRNVRQEKLEATLRSLDRSDLSEVAQSLDVLVQYIAATTIQSWARVLLARAHRCHDSLEEGSNSYQHRDRIQRVIVFGSINMDLKAETSGFWPRPGSAHLGTFSMSPGGKGANEAVALSRLGVPTTLVGRVGKDEMGRAVLEQLTSRQYRGLDCSRVRAFDDASTGVAVLFVTEADGQKGSVVCQGANGAAGDEEVAVILSLLPPLKTTMPINGDIAAHESISTAVGSPESAGLVSPTFSHGSSADKLHHTSISPPILLLQLELPVPPMLILAEEARRRGCLVVLKASPIAEEYVKGIEALLSEGIDWCFLNEWEAPTLLGWMNMTPLKAVDEAEQAAEAVLLRFPQLSCAVITCGVAHVLRQRQPIDQRAHSCSLGKPSPVADQRDPASLVDRDSSVSGRGTDASEEGDSLSSKFGSLFPRPGAAPIDEVSILVLPRTQFVFVDAIGAADAFVGGFLAAHVRGLPIDQKVLWAGAAADLSTMRPGGVNSMPHEDELLAYLNGAFTSTLLNSPKSSTQAANGSRGYKQNELHLTVLSGSMRRVTRTMQECSLDELATMLEEKDAFQVTPLQRAFDCYKLTKQSSLFLTVLRIFVCIHLSLRGAAIMKPIARLPVRKANSMDLPIYVPEISRASSGNGKDDSSDRGSMRPRRSLVHDMPGAPPQDMRRTSVSEKLPRLNLSADPLDGGASPKPMCPSATPDEDDSPVVSCVKRAGSLRLTDSTEIIGDGERLFGAVLPKKASEAAATAILALLRFSVEKKLDQYAREAQLTVAQTMALPCLQEELSNESTELNGQVTSSKEQGDLDDSESDGDDHPTVQVSSQTDTPDPGGAQPGRPGLAPPRRDSKPMNPPEGTRQSEDSAWWDEKSNQASRRLKAKKLKQALLTVKSPDGYTTLLAAAEAGSGALVRALLTNGASALDKNSEGENALHLAAKGKHREAVLALLECSNLPVSGPNSVDSHGRSPLDVSASLEFREELQQMYAAAKSATLVVRRMPSHSSSSLIYNRYYPFSKLGARLIIAEDVRTHRPVAIKTGNREQVEKEASTMRLIGPDNAPEVYDVFPDAAMGRYCLVMQAADAHSELDNVISRQKKRVGLEVRHHAQRLLSCVRAMHDLNLVHTDLKTKHFLRFDGEWKCIDFDSVISEGTEAIPNCTVRYAAPEVARSRLMGSPVVVTKAIDVWAMALVLFHFFTGSSLWGDVEVDERLVADHPETAVNQLGTNSELSAPQKRLLEEMLVVDPTKRKPLEEILAKSFFKEGEDTEQANFIEVLALFSSPKKLANGKGIPPLQLMREIVAIQSAIPRTLREIRPAARFPTDIEPVLRQLKPRIIQFSGHGNAVKRGAYAGALAFELPNGTIQLPSPQSFVDLLRKNICPRLELVFLNGCKTLSPLGEQIVEALPHLSVIGWGTVTADQAATAFAQGFYDSVARNCKRDRGGGSKGNLMEAYVSAERAFAEGGFIKADPALQKGAHGVYGILGHALVARRTGKLDGKKLDELKSGNSEKLKAMRNSFKLAHVVTSWSHLPLLAEQSLDGKTNRFLDDRPATENKDGKATYQGGQPDHI